MGVSQTGAPTKNLGDVGGLYGDYAAPIQSSHIRNIIDIHSVFELVPVNSVFELAPVSHINFC